MENAENMENAVNPANYENTENGYNNYPTSENDYPIYSVPASVSGNGIPIGMGVAFAKNLSALGVFAEMPTEKQTELIQRAQSVTSAEEMTALVNSLTSAT